MRLPSLFRRAPSGRANDRDAVEPSFSSSRSAAASSPSAEETIATLRARARRRLIGATVLVAAAVVSLPWLFESQPRPLPADLPIEMPRRDGPAASPDDHGVGKPDAAASSTVVAGASSGDAVLSPDIVAPAHVEATAKPAAPRASHPAVAPVPSSISTPSAEVAPDAARALALLDGKPTTPTASSAAGARYIVQIGAFAESEAVTSARGKAEHLGLKTYTQVIDAPAGRRTRVRVGPYATRAEAEHAVLQLKTVGLVAVVLTL